MDSILSTLSTLPSDRMPISRLAEHGLSVRSSNDPDLSQREELAVQFEGVFMSMLLKEMRSTLDGGLFGEENSDSYGALFDMYLGQQLADSNALGIRELMMNQWKSPNQIHSTEIETGNATNATQ